MKSEPTVFYLAFILILAIAVLNTLALVNTWYFTYWWFDILMHFLGGLWVGVFASWFLAHSYWRNTAVIRTAGSFGVVLGVAIVVALVWEGYEYAFGMVPASFDTYFADTTQDIFLGVSGGMCAWLLVRSSINRIVRTYAHI